MLRLVANLDSVNKMLEAPDLKHGHLSDKDFASTSVYSRFAHKESCSNDCREDHSCRGAPDHPEFKQYALEYGAAHLWEWGAGHRIPLSLPHYLLRGILMDGMCDYLMFALKRSAEMLFRKSKLLAQRCHQLFANRVRSRS
jgi:hypothetical protein